MITDSAVRSFESIHTPFYYYDIETLNKTLVLYTSLLKKYGFWAHYALKANANPKLISIIKEAGLGADCVSGNEVALAVKAGFPSSKIVYAGVGKSDAEIKTALTANIFSFNCESLPEIKVINDLAAGMGKVAKIALRINPDIDAHTHKYISTGRKEDKFGISPWMFLSVKNRLEECKNVELIGLHFHIGSQITDMNVFNLLCKKVDEIQTWFIANGMNITNINLGGGLGVDYENPNGNPIADFEKYFEIIHRNLVVSPNQRVHFEPGRALVAQCGHLISRVLYVKLGQKRKFVILDAGMNDLIRPALYQAHHAIENISSQSQRILRYDVVGPVCESSDTFGVGIKLPITKRGDLIAIHSAGAYGQVMAMRYNQRDIAKAYYSDELCR